MRTRQQALSSPRPLVITAGAAGGVLLLVLAGTAHFMTTAFGLSPLFAAKALGAYLFGLALLFVYLPQHLPHHRFGFANLVTLFRLTLACLLAGLFGERGSDIGWVIVSIALPAALLDGVDGWLARRSGLTSAFGARFDMETDGLFMLVLAILAWQFQKAGAWVLLAGMLRHLFVAAGYRFAWLRHSLPPSRRRQTICAIQILALVACLLPALDSPWSGFVAAVGLALLCYSFAADVLWLNRRAGNPTMKAH
jgi:phosphatidylglycerophosphate synthase